MEVLRILARIFQNSGQAFLYSLGIYVCSLVLNTSFRVMGFDLSSQIESAINPDFGLLILQSNLKVFLIYYIFFSSIQLFLSRVYEDLEITKKWYIPFFVLINLFLWFDSVVHYPQLYADFFYGKHPYLVFLLHLLTDYFPLTINQYLIAFTGLGFVIYLIVQLIRKNEIRYLFLLIYGIFAYIFHLHGNLFGMYLIFIVTKILYKQEIQTKRYTYIPVFLILLVLLSGYIFSFYQFSLPPEGKSEKPNVFIVSADSLRFDKIGYLVDGKSLTPNIDDFAKDSFRFQDHHVTIPRTFPSWADLLTGKYGMNHKIRDMFPAPSEAENLGKPEFQTLGHYLQKENFRTAVFSNFAGDIFPRADFGFKTIETPNFNAKVLILQKAMESQIFLLPILTGSLLGGGDYFEEIDSFAGLGDGKRIHRKLFPYLTLHKNSSLFVTIFHSVTHFPYSPPHPFYKKFTDPDYYGKFKYFKFVDPTSDAKPSEKDIEQIRSIFHASINAFDSDFGEFIQYLKDLGIYENSIIVLTGDHGESLYEDIHGQGHGEHLRGDHVTHVPLLIKTPKNLGTELTKNCKRESCLEFQGITSHIDITPTLLSLLKINPETEFPGKSIFSEIENINWKEPRAVYAETGIWFSDIGDHFFQKQRIMYPNILKLHRIVPEQGYQIMITDPLYRDTIAFSKHRALISGQYKFLYIPTNDGVIFEFYDRIKDPENRLNLYPNPNAEIFKKQIYNISQKWENSRVISDYIFPPPIE